MERRPTSTRSQGSVSESSSESSRPGSAPCGAATTSKVTRAPLAAFPGRKGNAPVAMETPEKEHPLCQELMTLITEGLTPNEVYGTVALVKSMRRNKNIMMKTEAREGTERYAIYEEGEGWTYHDLLDLGNLQKEHFPGDIDRPKNPFQRNLLQVGVNKSVQTAEEEGMKEVAIQTDSESPVTLEQRSESPADSASVCRRILSRVMMSKPKENQRDCMCCHSLTSAPVGL